MRQISLRTLVCLLFLLVFSTVALEGCSSSKMLRKTDVPRITKEELKPLLDDPDTIIIDYRIQMHWKKSDEKIKGAVHENPSAEVALWAGRYPKDKKIVLY